MIASTEWMDSARCAQDRKLIKTCPRCGRDLDHRPVHVECLTWQLYVADGWDGLTQQHKTRMCAGCPVRAECLAWTLWVEKGAGPRSREFVAGLSPTQRRALYRKTE